MPKVDVDLENDVIEPLPANIYACEVSGSNMKKDKNDSDMILWTLTVIDPEYVGFDLTYVTSLQNNVKTKDGEINTTARKKANYYLRLFLSTIGAEYGAGGFTTESALHCKCRAKVSRITIEGRIVNRVEEVLPFEAAA